MGLLLIQQPLLARRMVLVESEEQPTSDQNTPYIDDRLYHFGLALGLNFMSYRVVENTEPIEGERYYARSKMLLPGFSVGFITDLRLNKYLSLRFLPTFHFSNRSISFKNQSGKEFPPGNKGKTISVLSLPLDVPLFLKWTAVRERNYRPYFIIGGGLSAEIYRDKELAILEKPIDGFIGIGAGCNFYKRWFRFCPEIRYQVGFNNIIEPVSRRGELPKNLHFYTQTISKLFNQSIIIVFNIE